MVDKIFDNMNALLGALVIVVGWYIVHSLSSKRELRARRDNATREFLEQQISELYGPLLGLIEHSAAAFSIASNKLPHNGKGAIEFERFSADHTRIWRFFVEDYFIPVNAQIRALIRSKMHLLEGGVLPVSFVDFLKHEVNFEALHRLWKETGLESLEISGPGWPQAFENDVNVVLTSLRARHQIFLRKVSAGAA